MSAIELGPRQRASINELMDIYALLEEASSWLRERGIAQWNPVYPLGRFTREIEAGYVWYWQANGGVAATVTLLPGRLEYYPDVIWQDTIPAWYICRLAIRRGLSGAAVGERLLAQIADDAVAAGLRALRLDVTASNPFLEQYYLAQGFHRVALGAVKGEASIFMEKVLVW